MNEDGAVKVYIAFEAETADTLPVPVQPSWFPTRMAASLHEKSHPLACHISRSNIDSIDTFHGRCSVKHNADDWESEYLRTMCCQRLVCDLQGGYYGDYYILTDPVIEVRGCSLAFTSASDGSMAEAGRAMRTLVAQGTLGKSMVS